MQKYKVQRPTEIWIETTVEAKNLDDALDMANAKFFEAEFTELDDTFTVNYDRYWVETHDGLVFTESHAPRPHA